jgi:hypothetical protein
VQKENNVFIVYLMPFSTNGNIQCQIISQLAKTNCKGYRRTVCDLMSSTILAFA